MNIGLKGLGRAVFAGAVLLGLTAGASAEVLKVAGIYTQPIQQKWDARPLFHRLCP